MVGFSTSAVGGTEGPKERETVVLLHGLGLAKWSMKRVAHVLERDGYRVVNLSYPSRDMPIEDLARTWLPQQLATHEVASATRLHFVTHSMGGIVVRTWLREQTPPANLGRVVMLAPPNAGSEIVDRLHDFAPFRWFTGVNGRRLGTAPDALPRRLGPWPASKAELGIVAGDRTLNPLFAAWLPGPDDGKVSVAATHLDGERAHIVLHHSHTWLAWRRDTAEAARRFLRTGKFEAGKKSNGKNARTDSDVRG